MRHRQPHNNRNRVCTDWQACNLANSNRCLAFGGGGDILNLKFNSVSPAPLVPFDAPRYVAGKVAPLREAPSQFPSLCGPEGDGADLASIHSLQRTAQMAAP